MEKYRNPQTTEGESIYMVLVHNILAGKYSDVHKESVYIDIYHLTFPYIFHIKQHFLQINQIFWSLLMYERIIIGMYFVNSCV